MGRQDKPSVAEDSHRRAFDLLVESCRSCFAEPDRSRLRSMARDVDSAKFLALARRHRVQGLVWQALRGNDAFPLLGAIAASLAEEATEIAARGLRQAAESRRLENAFASAGVDLLFLKGLALGRLAYGDPFVKQGRDIDLLVASAEIEAAAVQLSLLGYRPVDPPAKEPARIAAWHRRNKESVWADEGGEHILELHCRLADSPALIPTIGMQSPRQSVELLPGLSLDTLAGDELATYLAVHGASSNWFRLKWLVDFAAILRDRDAAGLVAFVARAEEFGAGRAPALALSLCASLFGGPYAEASTASDGTIERLTARAMRGMAGLESLREPTERPFGTLPIHHAHLRLVPGWRHPVSEVSRKIVEQFDRRRFTGP